MSEEVTLKNLSSSGNGAIPYADEDVVSSVVNAPPRLGRSRIFAKEELMYATNHNPQQYQQHQQYSSSSNSNFRSPPAKASGVRSANPSAKSSVPERPENFQRRSKQIASRRVASKDAVDVEDENPLQRYENALLRYRKPNPGGLGGLRKERREIQNFSNNGYSSSDSECAITRYNKSKSTSSIDTQSVNNILDEYEDLDCGRSSDLSDSGSISVTNFEAVMDQRKRQQQQQLQQQQQYPVERSNREGTDEDVGNEPEGLQQQQQQQHQPEKHHDQRARIPLERTEPVFKVNQQTQVRQRSRDRQASTREATSTKLNSSSEEQSRSKNDTSSATTSDNRASIKQVPEVLLRKGEVQKRVDEWLNQAQSQNFAAPSGKRESGRIVALVRSSSSAEPKNSRRCRNDARSRSTDENSGDRLNGTASYDDINRTEAARTERKVDRTKNVPAGATRGTYKDYLAVRNRTKHPTDYGFVHGSARSNESSTGGSRIPQRGHLSTNLSARRRQIVDDNVEDGATASTTSTSPATPSAKQEKNLSRSARLVAVETRIASSFVKTRPEQLSSNGSTVGTALTPIYANGRAASFKRSRSHERNTGIAGARCTGVLVKEDQQSGNARIRGGHQQHQPPQQQQQQFVSKGQLAKSVDQSQQQATATSPNKVGESRRLLVAGRQSRVREDSIEGTCSKSSEGSLLLQQQQRVETNEKEEDTVGQRNEEFNKFIIHRNPSCGAKEKEEEKASRMIENLIDASCSPVVQVSPRSPEESRAPRARVIRENSDGIEQSRRPPAPPRRDQSRRDRTEQTTSNDLQSTDRSCSSFRPNKRMYSALRQLNEQNSFTGTCNDSLAQTSDLSTAKSHYAAPKKIEKIYDRSATQSRVIHSNDLESLLKPVVRASAYGEASDNQKTPLAKDISTIDDKTDAEIAAQINRDRTETVEDNRTAQSPRNARYPEIGLDQCLKMQRRHPSAKMANKDIAVEKRDLPTVHTKNSWDRDEGMVSEPVKTFGTFQPGNTIQCQSPASERNDKKILCMDNSEDIDEAVVADLIDEPTYQELDLIPTINVSIANSYEARSTLRLDRNLCGIGRDTDNRRNENVPFDPVVVRGEKSQLFNTKIEPCTSEHSSPLNYSGNSVDAKSSVADEKKSFSRENCDDERGAVVNEVLVKNLRFQQDVLKHDSPIRLGGPIIASKPFNFNSVLSDDYEKIQAGDCGTKHSEDTKIYVTKEEMERQKMVDLLRRGDYEAVKLVRIARILQSLLSESYRLYRSYLVCTQMSNK